MYAAFRRTSDGAVLGVRIRLQRSGMNDVRLTPSEGGPSACSPPDYGNATPPLFPNPGLFMGPDDELYHFEGVPGGRLGPGIILSEEEAAAYQASLWVRYTFQETADVFTDRPTSQIEGLFEPQLEALGWKRVGGQTSDSLAWSIWDVPGEGTWHGFVMVSDAPGSRRHSLLIRVVPISEDTLSGRTIPLSILGQRASGGIAQRAKRSRVSRWSVSAANSSSSRITSPLSPYSSA